VRNPDDGTSWALVRVASQGFVGNQQNRRLLQRLAISGALGAAIAFAVALLGGSLLSERLSRRTRRIASGLEEITRGARKVPFPERLPVELAVIRESADRLQTRLREEEELRRVWAQDVAHDLRTPVTALRAQLEALEDGVIERSPEAFAPLRTETERLSRLIEALSQLSRLESPELKPALREVSLREFVDELVSAFHVRARRRGLTIVSKASEASVETDPDLLSRACTNLLDNAIRYASGTGKLLIEANTEGTEALIRVSNPGSFGGTDPRLLFGRLVRGEASRESANAREGSGLGLTIAQTIARRLGGDLVPSESDGMVHLEIRLPAGRYS
jgi:two-component system sensor histidine kinase BaeS